MVTAVWGGNKNNEAITDRHVTGGSVMAAIWKQFNSDYYKKVPTPAGELVSVKACYDGYDLKPSATAVQRAAAAKQARELNNAKVVAPPLAAVSSTVASEQPLPHFHRTYHSRYRQARVVDSQPQAVDPEHSAQPVVLKSRSGITDYGWTH